MRTEHRCAVVAYAGDFPAAMSKPCVAGFEVRKVRTSTREPMGPLRLCRTRTVECVVLWIAIKLTEQINDVAGRVTCFERIE